jgi:hypothetical protein
MCVYLGTPKNGQKSFLVLRNQGRPKTRKHTQTFYERKTHIFLKLVSCGGVNRFASKRWSAAWWWRPWPWPWAHVDAVPRRNGRNWSGQNWSGGNQFIFTGGFGVPYYGYGSYPYGYYNQPAYGYGYYGNQGYGYGSGNQGYGYYGNQGYGYGNGNQGYVYYGNQGYGNGNQGYRYGNGNQGYRYSNGNQGYRYSNGNQRYRYSNGNQRQAQKGQMRERSRHHQKGR